MTLLLYIEGQLDRKRAQEVSAHTQECQPCRTLLRALERESRLLTRAMLEEEEAAPARSPHFSSARAIPCNGSGGCCLGLAATGVYALYTEYVVPVQQRFEQAGFGSSSLLNF